MGAATSIAATRRAFRLLDQISTPKEKASA
jgi:hypothetical protein